MYKILLIFSMMAFIPTVQADESYGSATVSIVTSIYDADTFRVNIDDWPAVVGDNVPVRVSGIDAPELRGKCELEKVSARKAKQFTVKILRNGKHIELRNIRRGKYFRLLADVYVDSRNLGRELIDKGYARNYSGGKRFSWCQ